MTVRLLLSPVLLTLISSKQTVTLWNGCPQRITSLIVHRSSVDVCSFISLHPLIFLSRPHQSTLYLMLTFRLEVKVDFCGDDCRTVVPVPDHVLWFCLVPTFHSVLCPVESILVWTACFCPRHRQPRVWTTLSFYPFFCSRLFLFSSHCSSPSSPFIPPSDSSDPRSPSFPSTSPQRRTTATCPWTAVSPTAAARRGCSCRSRGAICWAEPTRFAGTLRFRPLMWPTTLDWWWPPTTRWDCQLLLNLLKLVQYFFVTTNLQLRTSFVFFSLQSFQNF